MSELTEGSPAPAFTGLTQDGSTISLADYKGKFVALYFYPKDDTPGCTTQACSFRDHITVLRDLDVEVIGVSADDVESHRKFAHKHQLNFPLIADTDKKLVEAYGVWKEKSMYGKTYMGVERSCFLIDPEGRLLKIWRKVKPDENVDLLLKAL